MRWKTLLYVNCISTYIHKEMIISWGDQIFDIDCTTKNIQCQLSQILSSQCECVLKSVRWETVVISWGNALELPEREKQFLSCCFLRQCNQGSINNFQKWTTPELPNWNTLSDLWHSSFVRNGALYSLQSRPMLRASSTSTCCEYISCD
jgi:hypothetical protein